MENKIKAWRSFHDTPTIPQVQCCAPHRGSANGRNKSKRCHLRCGSSGAQHCSRGHGVWVTEVCWRFDFIFHLLSRAYVLCIAQWVRSLARVRHLARVPGSGLHTHTWGSQHCTSIARPLHAHCTSHCTSHCTTMKTQCFKHIHTFKERKLPKLEFSLFIYVLLKTLCFHSRAM